MISPRLLAGGNVPEPNGLVAATRCQGLAIRAKGHAIDRMGDALAAGLVRTAEEWRFGSSYNWIGGESCGVKLASWPLRRLPIWLERVNRPVSEKKWTGFEGLSGAVSRSGTPDGWSQGRYSILWSQRSESAVDHANFPKLQLGSSPFFFSANQDDAIPSAYPRFACARQCYGSCYSARSIKSCCNGSLESQHG